VWDLERGEQIKSFEASQRIAAMTLSSDGHTLCAAGTDSGLIAWDTATGGVVRTSSLPRSPSSIAFAPDGRHLAIANRHGMVLIVRLRQ
jgi:WD40 repeat protein